MLKVFPLLKDFLSVFVFILSFSSSLTVAVLAMLKSEYRFQLSAELQTVIYAFFDIREVVSFLEMRKIILNTFVVRYISELIFGLEDLFQS